MRSYSVAYLVHFISISHLSLYMYTYEGTLDKQLLYMHIYIYVCTSSPSLFAGDGPTANGKRKAAARPLDEEECTTPRDRITRRRSSVDSATHSGGQVGVLGLPASGSDSPEKPKSKPTVSHRVRAKSTPPAKKSVKATKKAGKKNKKEKKGKQAKKRKQAKEGKASKGKAAASKGKAAARKPNIKKAAKGKAAAGKKKTATAAKSKAKQPQPKTARAVKPAKPQPAAAAVPNPDEAETQLLPSSPSLPALPALTEIEKDAAPKIPVLPASLQAPASAQAPAPERSSLPAPAVAAEQAPAQVAEQAPAEVAEHAPAQVAKQAPAEAAQQAAAQVAKQAPPKAEEQAAAQVAEQAPADAPEQAAAQVAEQAPAMAVQEQQQCKEQPESPEQIRQSLIDNIQRCSTQDIQAMHMLLNAAEYAQKEQDAETASTKTGSPLATPTRSENASEGLPSPGSAAKSEEPGPAGNELQQQKPGEAPMKAELTPEEKERIQKNKKAQHARYMRFSRSLTSLVLRSLGI